VSALQRLYKERVQANSDALDGSRYAMVGSGLDLRVGRSLKYWRRPLNRILLSLAHGFSHRISRLGNPDFCGDGPLTGLT